MMCWSSGGVVSMYCEESVVEEFEFVGIGEESIPVGSRGNR